MPCGLAAASTGAVAVSLAATAKSGRLLNPPMLLHQREAALPVKHASMTAEMRVSPAPTAEMRVSPVLTLMRRP